MNERIEKLAEQAGLLGPSSRVGNSHDATERFAQLLVQDCLNICEEMGDNGKDGHYCADAIVRLFK